MRIPHLILASASPRRKLLLRQIGLTFTVDPSRVDERLNARESPSKNARRIALEKVTEVARRRGKGIVGPSAHGAQLRQGVRADEHHRRHDERGRPQPHARACGWLELSARRRFNRPAPFPWARPEV